jgi:hypothetical protein
MVSAVLEHENGHVVQDLEGLDMEKMIGIRNDPRAMTKCPGCPGKVGKQPISRRCSVLSSAGLCRSQTSQCSGDTRC